MLAGNRFYTPNLEMGPCQGCGASRAHYVAAIARNFPLDILQDQIEMIKQHMQDKDIFGNIPLHFIASSGPTSVEQLKLFISCWEDQYWSNLDGECYLHTLDPSAIEADLPHFLRELCVRHKRLLRARTYDGRTVLHCLLARIHDMSTVGKVLPIFQSARVNMHARDNRGKTAFDFLCERWSSRSFRRTAEQLDQLKHILACHVPNMKLMRCGDQILIVTVPPNSTPEEIERICDGQSPKGRYSDDFSQPAQVQRYREMRDVIQESLRNPLAQDYRGRNGLHCFAHRLHLMSESENVAEECKQDLMELLDKGVGPNEYDMNKQTPLHVFLSAHHNPQSQKLRSFLSNLLIARSMGHNDEIIHMRDANGDTPLHLACKAGLVACVAKLLTHLANVNALNYRGRSVIYEAKQAKMSKNPAEAAKIQSCIELVEKANGKEDPVPPELVLWNGDVQSVYCCSLFGKEN
jgi:ankyrin repeat protein